MLACYVMFYTCGHLWAEKLVSEGIYIALFFFLHAQRSVNSSGKCQEVVEYKSQPFTILQHLASSRGHFLLLLGDIHKWNALLGPGKHSL